MEFIPESSRAGGYKAIFKVSLSGITYKIGDWLNIKMLQCPSDDKLIQLLINLLNFMTSDAVVEPFYEMLLDRSDSSYIEQVLQQTASQWINNNLWGLNESYVAYIQNAAFELIGEMVSRSGMYSRGVAKIRSFASSYANFDYEPESTLTVQKPVTYQAYNDEL